jgi:CBS domain containing-hemolysin-like protein
MFGDGLSGLLIGAGVVIGLVLLNGFFVASEFALVKVRMTQIETLLQRRRPMARLAKHVVSRLDTYLSATQLGITLASLGLGWAGKPAVEVFLRGPLGRLGWSAETTSTVSFGIAFLLITFLHIVLGELAPKSLAILKPQEVTLAVAGPLAVFYRIFYPVIWLLDHASRVILKSVGLKAVPGHEVTYSEEELRIVISGSKEREVSGFARAMALAALDLRRRPVREIIIPRTQIAFLSTRRSLEQNLRVARESGFTRYPLCEESIEEVLGMVHVKDLLWTLHDAAGSAELRELQREIHFMPETLPLEEALLRFLRSKHHMALVLDEYGGTLGMVTLEDVLEELVGEIQDEFDHESPPIIKVPGKEEYIAEGTAALHQVNALLGVTLQAEGVDTLSGYLIHTLGRLPSPDEELQLDGLSFRILKVGRRRIHRVVVLKGVKT